MADNFLQDTAIKIIVTIITTLAVASLTLLFKSIRNLIFYTRAEYDLIAEKKPNESPFKRRWIINWENNRLEFEAGDISNDKIDNVTFKNAVGKKDSIKNMHPSERFTDIFDGALGVKINSIVRRDRPSPNDLAAFTLRFVVRRKRWNS
jgi:hypothetical protein